ncbi:hypothetical protein E5E00_02970 [Helicobacter pylori]|nr:hypothetical protein E5E00_01110 [Helicobacter pylori]WQT65833.1 hypothetical protein E5E00_02970 [Helicobacter pylori]
MEGILEFERKFRVWKEWIQIIGNDFEMIGDDWKMMKMMKMMKLMEMILNGG